MADLGEAGTAEIVEATRTLPDGDYAIVEMLGHRTVIGRMTEVEKFGTKFLALEMVFGGELLPAIMIGGASVYCITPCSAEQAAKKAPTRLYGLPSGAAVLVPPHLLPPPEPEPRSWSDAVGFEDDD